MSFCTCTWAAKAPTHRYPHRILEIRQPPEYPEPFLAQARKRTAPVLRSTSQPAQPGEMVRTGTLAVFLAAVVAAAFRVVGAQARDEGHTAVADQKEQHGPAGDVTLAQNCPHGPTFYCSQRLSDCLNNCQYAGSVSAQQMCRVGCHQSWSAPTCCG